jgi:peptide deformylase
MPREILKYPHPALTKKSLEIGEITPELRALAQEMAELMYDKRGIGLAAPQVGECCRLIALDLSGPDERNELMFLVNPVLVSQEGQQEEEEGCLSVSNLRAKVKRAAKVLVRATDLDGNPLEIEAEELKAVCLQHEMDHLDGILFLDHLSRLKRALYDGKVKKWHRQKKPA